MKLGKRLFVAAALATAAAPAWAQVTISAEVNKTEVAADEQITLAVTESGADSNLPAPHIPPLSDLSVYDSGQSQSLSIVNGQVSSSIVYTYVAIPRKVGKIVIPPISVTYKGRTVQTQPIDITVRKGAPVAPNAPGAAQRRQAAPPSAMPGMGGKDFFVSADVDKKKPYVNEQVTLSVHVCTGVDLMQGPQYDPPPLSGFLAEDLPPPERQANITAHGRPYHCWLIKTALFPAQAGRLTIGSARAQVVAMPRLDDVSGDVFDRFFQQGMGRPLTDVSEPVVIVAQPLPEAGKPADFSGTVGRYVMTAAVDRSRVKTGDAVNLTVTVAGEGNLKTVGAPTLPDMPSARVFDTVSSLSLDKRGDVVRGTKVFKTVLVPRVSGALTIPPIRLDFFDPASRAYRSVQSAPIRLDVAPGEANAPLTGGPSASAAPGITSVSQDLRYLMTAPRRGPLTGGLEALAAAGYINAVPFAAFIVALGWSEQKRRSLLDPKGARARAARRAAQEKLRQAREAGDPAVAAARLSEALAGYLADKLGQPASGLTLKRVQELLRQRRPGAPTEVLDQLKELWEDLDMRRFAPTAAGENIYAVADRVDSLVERLDKEILR